MPRTPNRDSHYEDMIRRARKSVRRQVTIVDSRHATHQGHLRAETYLSVLRAHLDFLEKARDAAGERQKLIQQSDQAIRESYELLSRVRRDEDR